MERVSNVDVKPLISLYICLLLVRVDHERVYGEWAYYGLLSNKTQPQRVFFGSEIKKTNSFQGK